MGHPYQSWWCGSDLDIEESRRLVPHQNATTMQLGVLPRIHRGGYPRRRRLHVDAREPTSGLCVPDDPPHDYVLNVSKPYLGKFISMSSDWNPLKHYPNGFHGYNQPQLDTSDPWQFKNFLITEGDEDKALDRIRDTRTPIEVSVASVPAEGSGRIQCLRQRNNHSSRLSDVPKVRRLPSLVIEARKSLFLRSVRFFIPRGLL
jgi:hypothetical protein